MLISVYIYNVLSAFIVLFYIQFYLVGHRYFFLLLCLYYYCVILLFVLYDMLVALVALCHL